MMIDLNSASGHAVKRHLEKIVSSNADLNMTPEGFSKKYYVTLKIRVTEIRG